MNISLYNEQTSDVEREIACRKAGMVESYGCRSYIHNSLFYLWHVKASFPILCHGVFRSAYCACAFMFTCILYISCALWMLWCLIALEKQQNGTQDCVILSFSLPSPLLGWTVPLFAHWNGLFCLLAPLNTIISIHKWDIASSCLLLCAYSHSLLFLSHYLNLAHTQTSPSAFVSLLLLHTCPLWLICLSLAALPV